MEDEEKINDCEECGGSGFGPDGSQCDECHADPDYEKYD